MKTEAVGVPAYIFDNGPARVSGEGGQPLVEGGIGTSVNVPVERQYFMMVSAAAFSIERILAQRLSNMGSVDASAVAAELAQSITAIREAEKAKKDAKGGTSGTASGENGTPEGEMMGLMVEPVPREEMARLDLDVLKPKLDACVIRAKL